MTDNKKLNDINSLEDTAAYFGISPEVLKAMARQKKIGSLKIGRTWTFPRAAIEAYVAAHTVSANPEPPNPWGLTPRALHRVTYGTPKTRR